MRKTTWLSGILLLLLGACTQVDVTMPKGEQGDPGLSAYEYWKSQVAAGTIKWPAEAVELADYMKYIKGDKGRDGANGESAYDLWYRLVANPGIDNPHKAGEKWPASENTQADFYRFLTGATGESGQIPHVGEDGNWYVGTRNTGQRAKGKEAKAPVVEVIDGKWHVNGQDLGVVAIGKNGKDGKDAPGMPTVTVNADGYWVIDGNPSKVKAKGTDGAKPEIAISEETGKWMINGVEQDDHAFGKNGKDGQDGSFYAPAGESAYDLWVEAIADGKMPNPLKPGEFWNPDDNTYAHFWLFLTGQDPNSSVPPDNGFPAEPGQPGKPVIIERGKPNVIAQFYDQGHSEYVRPGDGGVLYAVYDDKGLPAPGAKVSGMPGIDPKKEYTANEKGEFLVPAEDLPSIQDISKRYGTTAKVTYRDKTMESAKNTYVPNRIHIRFDTQYYSYRVSASDSNGSVVSSEEVSYPRIDFDADASVRLYISRRLNPEDDWEKLPDYLFGNRLFRQDLFVQVHEVLDPYTVPFETRLVKSNQYEQHFWAEYFYFWIPELFGMKPTEIPTDQPDFKYATLKSRSPLYGQIVEWNGVAKLSPLNPPPYIESIKLKARRGEGDITSFATVSIKINTSRLNLDYFSYPSYGRGRAQVTKNSAGVEIYSLVPPTHEEIRKSHGFVVTFQHAKGTAKNSGSSAMSINEGEVTLIGAFLNSDISIQGSNEGTSLVSTNSMKIGRLVEKAPGVYAVELDSDYAKDYPPIVVTYED